MTTSFLTLTCAQAALVALPGRGIPRALGVLAAERARQTPVALLVLTLAIAWDTLLRGVGTLPETVPVAVGLVLAEAVRRPRGSAPVRASARSQAATSAS